jgi:hypothetical protein
MPAKLQLVWKNRARKNSWNFARLAHLLINNWCINRLAGIDTVVAKQVTWKKSNFFKTHTSDIAKQKEIIQ